MNPTSLSKICLVCCALTISISIERGFSTEYLTAFGVISLNTIRNIFSSGTFKTCLTCHAMASPSRSGSDAKYILSLFLAKSFNFVTTFCLPDIISNFGSKLLLTSKPRLSVEASFCGRFLICPKLASI